MFKLLIVLLLIVPRAGLDRSLASVERELVKSPVECGAGFAPSGHLAFKDCGASSIHFTPTADQAAAIANGGVFTHNHPDRDGNCWTLSYDDVYLAEQLQLAEIRAVSFFDGMYRVSVLRRIGPIFPYIPLDIVEAEAGKQIAVGGAGRCLYMERTWIALAPRYGLAYFTEHVIAP